jgi:hypothetical protein
MFLGKDERATPVKNQDIPIAYRISVLEQREGLNWIARPRREGE